MLSGQIFCRPKRRISRVGAFRFFRSGGVLDWLAPVSSMTQSLPVDAVRDFSPIAVGAFYPRFKRIFMKPSTKDQIKGKGKEIKGDVKEKVGKAVGRRDIEDEGQAEKTAGKVQKKVGQIEKVFGK